jgi:hypothetical protein
MNETKDYYPFQYGYLSDFQHNTIDQGSRVLVTTTAKRNYVGESGVYLSKAEIEKANRACNISTGICLMPALLFIVGAIIYFINADEWSGLQGFVIFCIPAGILTGLVYKIAFVFIYPLIGWCFKKSAGINVGEINILEGNKSVINLFQEKELEKMKSDPSFERTIKEKGLGGEFQFLKVFY